MRPKRTISRDLRDDTRLAARFWAKVPSVSESDCWPFTGYTSQTGYGKILIEKRVHFAHRIAWELTHGPIPDGMRVLHRCDNRPCCNPSHLFLGTLSDNMRDMWGKGRHPKPARRVVPRKGTGQLKGEAHLSAKLTTPDVLRIRREGGSIDARKALAAEYGVTYQNIAAIVRGRTWKHV